jgi:hypothetical protein
VSPVALARAQGVFNVFSGVWPLVHMRSFEVVFGPKVDRWLVRTVAGLLVTNGVAQLLTPPSSEGVRQARRIGVGTAATLAATDLYYVPAGRISRRYLLDAVAELSWLAAWAATGRSFDR